MSPYKSKARNMKRVHKEGNYNLAWKYIKESKNYFLFIILLFFGSIVIGFMFPVFFVDIINNIIQNLVKQTAGLNFIQMLLFILQNNISTAFMGIIFGVFLGLIPCILAFFNGYVLGFIAGKSVAIDGVSVLWKLVPHGVFEIPALILSLGLGVRLGSFILARDKKQAFYYHLENCFRVFLLVILPLLLIAGLIETLLIAFAS